MIRIALFGLLGLVLAACSSAPRFLHYDGPQVTQVRIHKTERLMELMHYDTVLRSYPVQLGGNPIGHKQHEGDRRTPEGEYIIDRRNPASAFHLSLGMSYPNADDIARAEEAGHDPGSDIFIHGRGPNVRRPRGDWTDGCIAVRDHEIEQIYAMVRDGTPISIYP
ncbi:MAG: L,D-transpeptidase catalytic domain [Rhodobacteraceae bacterium HLUCCA12]|nr:MAG: L,D-transpeptidase catalytic domain [Rhodobacteraceae bacterium HLUCCA12]